jgi:magnesium-transporting ATPase (P-type)
MDFDCLVLCNGNQFAEPIFNRQGQKQNLDLNNLSAAYPNFRLALNNMAMNHTIVNVEETKENVGDPMEIKLF